MRFVLLLLLVTSTASQQGFAMGNCPKGLVEAQAKLEIEYLRRKYARATDLIGEATPASIERGRKIYHEIFTKDAKMDAGPDREPQVGPDAWVDLVLGALGELGPTQHLIGTQVVELIDFEVNDNCEVIAGTAKMESYVQAWHEQKDERVWVFLGTYFDDIEFVPGKGWQVTNMVLTQVAGETRYMDAAVGKAE